MDRFPNITDEKRKYFAAMMSGMDDAVGLVLAKIQEEAREIEEALDAGASKETVAGEVGDLLFAVANLARHLDADPEAALRTTNAKFERRFAHIEARLATAGKTTAQASLEEMDALWNEAKGLESQGDVSSS